MNEVSIYLLMSRRDQQASKKCDDNAMMNIRCGYMLLKCRCNVVQIVDRKMLYRGEEPQCSRKLSIYSPAHKNIGIYS